MDSHGIAGLEEIIGPTYEASLWPNVLGHLTAHGHGTCTVPLVLDPSSSQPIQRMFDKWPGYDRYLAPYARLDLRNAYGMRLPTGSCFTDLDRIVEWERDRS